MSAQPSTRYLNCPECKFTALRAGFPAWTTCPRCRARGRRIELLVRDALTRRPQRLG